MTSSFNVHKASGYEKLMGRWSRRLAPRFIEFAGVNSNERIIDVGCGTGSLTFALPNVATISQIVGSTIRQFSSRKLNGGILIRGSA